LTEAPLHLLYTISKALAHPSNSGPVRRSPPFEEQRTPTGSKRRPALRRAESGRETETPRALRIAAIQSGHFGTRAAAIVEREAGKTALEPPRTSRTVGILSPEGATECQQLSLSV
jgi:hypothetical protein